jgi:ribose transport system substrate-binding protein
MGFQAVVQAFAHLNGVASVPPRIETGFVMMTIDNVDDPEVAQYIYSG